MYKNNNKITFNEKKENVKKLLKKFAIPEYYFLGRDQKNTVEDHASDLLEQTLLKLKTIEIKENKLLSLFEHLSENYEYKEKIEKNLLNFFFLLDTDICDILIENIKISKETYKSNQLSNGVDYKSYHLNTITKNYEKFFAFMKFIYNHNFEDFFEPNFAKQNIQDKTNIQDEINLDLENHKKKISTFIKIIKHDLDIFDDLFKDKKKRAIIINIYNEIKNDNLIKMENILKQGTIEIINSLINFGYNEKYFIDLSNTNLNKIHSVTSYYSKLPNYAMLHNLLLNLAKNKKHSLIEKIFEDQTLDREYLLELVDIKNIIYIFSNTNLSLNLRILNFSKKLMKDLSETNKNRQEGDKYKNNKGDLAEQIELIIENNKEDKNKQQELIGFLFDLLEQKNIEEYDDHLEKIFYLCEIGVLTNCLHKDFYYEWKNINSIAGENLKKLSDRKFGIIMDEFENFKKILNLINELKKTNLDNSNDLENSYKFAFDLIRGIVKIDKKISRMYFNVKIFINFFQKIIDTFNKYKDQGNTIVFKDLFFIKIPFQYLKTEYYYGEDIENRIDFFTDIFKFEKEKDPLTYTYIISILDNFQSIKNFLNYDFEEIKNFLTILNNLEEIKPMPKMSIWIDKKAINILSMILEKKISREYNLIIESLLEKLNENDICKIYKKIFFLEKYLHSKKDLTKELLHELILNDNLFSIETIEKINNFEKEENFSLISEKVLISFFYEVSEEVLKNFTSNYDFYAYYEERMNFLLHNVEREALFLLIKILNQKSTTDIFLSKNQNEILKITDEISKDKNFKLNDPEWWEGKKLFLKYDIKSWDISEIKSYEEFIDIIFNYSENIKELKKCIADKKNNINNKNSQKIISAFRNLPKNIIKKLAFDFPFEEIKKFSFLQLKLNDIAPKDFRYQNEQESFFKNLFFLDIEKVIILNDFCKIKFSVYNFMSLFVERFLSVIEKNTEISISNFFLLDKDTLKELLSQFHNIINEVNNNYYDSFLESLSESLFSNQKNDSDDSDRSDNDSDDSDRSDNDSDDSDRSDNDSDNDHNTKELKNEILKKNLEKASGIDLNQYIQDNLIIDNDSSDSDSDSDYKKEEKENLTFDSILYYDFYRKLINIDDSKYYTFFEKCKKVFEDFNEIDMGLLSRALNDVNQIDDKEQNYRFVKFVFDFDEKQLEKFQNLSLSKLIDHLNQTFDVLSFNDAKEKQLFIVDFLNQAFISEMRSESLLNDGIYKILDFFKRNNQEKSFIEFLYLKDNKVFNKIKNKILFDDLSNQEDKCKIFEQISKAEKNTKNTVLEFFNDGKPKADKFNFKEADANSLDSLSK